MVVYSVFKLKICIGASDLLPIEIEKRDLLFLFIRTISVEFPPHVTVVRYFF
ncbi:uncharacterized protein METZ01_LOCUS509642 [marine metagenome]|uniref:Uncharacterized protein n=1 Tax=marine metagenome TaxID=408172 RepID=A0A383EL22_9ZZZZ